MPNAPLFLPSAVNFKMVIFGAFRVGVDTLGEIGRWRFARWDAETRRPGPTDADE
jgi:hypothetical protein